MICLGYSNKINFAGPWVTEYMLAKTGNAENVSNFSKAYEILQFLQINLQIINLSCKCN